MHETKQLGSGTRPLARRFGLWCVIVLFVAARRVIDLPLQSGHDNWVRALSFHPSGKFLLSGCDDKTIRVWELASGRCVKTVEAHGHFVGTIAWGRATLGGGEGSTEDAKRINVLATGSEDQSVKIWTP